MSTSNRAERLAAARAAKAAPKPQGPTQEQMAEIYRDRGLAEQQRREQSKRNEARETYNRQHWRYPTEEELEAFMNQQEAPKLGTTSDRCRLLNELRRANNG